jgi:hypothetical protein
LGGTIIPVTTLNSDGPGSLAEALAATGPRVIVFEVGGVIDLSLQTLRIKQPYVTIAGQTAPSPGITLIKGTLSITTHDVVVQHIRVRPGEAGQSVGWEPDGISLVSANDVVIDHCSVTWAIDENLSASGPRFEGATPDEWRANTSHRVTMSHNIVAEALSNSTHAKGEHSKGSLIHDNATEILIYGSLYASNVDRNPLFKGGARGAVVNNFITNPRRYAVTYGLVASEWGEEPYQTGMISMVGNVFHHGLDTLATGAFFRASGGPVDIFLQDNVAQDLGGNPVAWLAGDLAQINELDAVAYWPDGLSVLPSGEVLQNVLDQVGARPWDRDSVDSRIVEQALAGTGKQIDHEQEGGGYPPSAPTYSPFVAAEWDDCFERIP